MVVSMKPESTNAEPPAPYRAMLRLLAVLACALVFAGCGEAQTTQSGPQRVELDPENAVQRGQAQYKCWSGGCWWVVWCGHNICEGEWEWEFPASGNYEIIWQGVSYKCAGAPPYELRINGSAVRSDELAQYGSCGECIPGNMPEVFEDTSLGQYELNKGDRITLWIRNDFACGIDGPGAYAAFESVTAEKRE
jgi:hypothetical protein